MDPKKVAVVQDWPVPTGAAQLRSFLRFANYGKFIAGWAAMATRLLC